MTNSPQAPQGQAFLTPTGEDPFEKLQKWTTWLFGLNPILAALAFGTGSLVLKPKGTAAFFPAASILLFGVSLAFTAMAYGTAVAEVQPTTPPRTFDDEKIRLLRGAYDKKRGHIWIASVALGVALIFAALTPLATLICGPDVRFCRRSPQVVLAYELKDTVVAAGTDSVADAQVLHARATGREFPQDRLLSLTLESADGSRSHAHVTSGPDSLGALSLGVSEVFIGRDDVRLEAEWCRGAEDTGECTTGVDLHPAPRGR